MANQFHKKSIFESDFDSFEFDDGFLMRLDSDLKKNKTSEKQNDTKKFNSKAAVSQIGIQEKKEKKTSEIKSQYYDLPLFIEDLNESDFFEQSNNKKNKNHSSKVAGCTKNGKSGTTPLLSPNFISCLSPIPGKKTTAQLNISSSTPVKPSNESNSKDRNTTEDKLDKNWDYIYSEADLFDDWDVDEKTKTVCTPKSTVTMSQALKLIDEAEFARESDQKESLNQSINLLTGEVVYTDMGAMFDESFGVPESAGNEPKDAESSNESIVVLEESKTTRKPAAAQKLNFGSDKANLFNLDVDKENHFGSLFNSDDDFDFLTQDLLDKPKEVSKCAKPKFELPKSDRVTPLKDCDPNDSTDAVIRFKRGKCLKVIESDTTEDSPSPKFRRQMKKPKKRKNNQENFGKEFIESEAEVSDEVEVSSDEAEEDGEYDKSFLDEESYFTQNCSANMTTKYLESVKGVSAPGRFKIPAAKPFNPDNVFSQVPEENDADYEIDSFCVNEVEEEAKTDLSDLEVAEKILEMDRKKRKRKRSQKLRR